MVTVAVCVSIGSLSVCFRFCPIYMGRQTGLSESFCYCLYACMSVCIGACNDSFVDLWNSGKPANTWHGTGSAAELFLTRVLDIIQRHDFSAGVPLYIYYTPPATHDPLQIPKKNDWIVLTHSTIWRPLPRFYSFEYLWCRIPRCSSWLESTLSTKYWCHDGLCRYGLWCY